MATPAHEGAVALRSSGRQKIFVRQFDLRERDSTVGRARSGLRPTEFRRGLKPVDDGDRDWDNRDRSDYSRQWSLKPVDDGDRD